MELLGLALVFVLVVGMIILAVRGLFARDLTQALRRVTQQEQDLQAKAEILERRLAQLEKDHHVKLKQAEAESQRLIQEAKQQAMNIRTAAIEEAKHRTRQLVVEAEQLRGQMKQEVWRELNGQATAWACEAIKMLLSSEEQLSLHERLVLQLVEELNRLDLSHLKGHVDCAQITSAGPLGEEQARTLQERFSMRLGQTIRLEVTTDATLIAGCVMHIGDLIVDGSLKHYMMQRGSHG